MPCSRSTPSCAPRSRQRPARRSRPAPSPWHDVTDVVPAARTVLLLTREGTDLTALSAAVRSLPDSVRLTDGSDTRSGCRKPQRKSHEVEVVVRYDGPDLDEVAALTGLTRAEVVAAHTGTPWRVAFGGFAPGFAYLVGGDPRLHVPRRDRPRPSVPAGSVGLAGEFSGVYPRSSPGGWQLLGTTDAVLWDADREPPALLGPGTTVRFVDAAASDMSPTLEVLGTGPLVLVEDDGRPGLAAVGVGRSGAADRGSYRLGARLVGHAPGLAALEVLLGGLTVRAHGRVTVALTGAPAPATVDGRPVAHAGLVDVPDGATLTLGMPVTGLRTYLTVRGGIDVPPVLGSRSTDTLSQLGPPPVRVGDVLPVGAPGRGFPTVDHVAHPSPDSGGPGGARGAARPARGLGGRLAHGAGRPARGAAPGVGGQRPGRGAAGRLPRAAGGALARRRAAQRGDGAWRRAGATRRGAGAVPRRPPRDRRLPRGRGAHGIRLRPRRPAAAGRRGAAGSGRRTRLRRVTRHFSR